MRPHKWGQTISVFLEKTVSMFGEKLFMVKGGTFTCLYVPYDLSA